MTKKAAIERTRAAAGDKPGAAAKPLRSGVARKPGATAKPNAGQYDGTEEELIAFFDRLIERGDQLKAEIEELHAQIRKSM